MLHQAILDLARPDPVPRAGDHVVRPAEKPEMPLGILPAHVAGEEVLAREFVTRRRGIVPVAEEHHGVGAADRDLAGLSSRHRRALLVDYPHLVAWNGAAHGARTHREKSGIVADHEIAFGLAVELVDRDAESLAAP